MINKFAIPLVLAAMIGGALAEVSDQRGFEELTQRAAIADQASAPGARCPLSKEYFDKADLGLLSICLKYGLAAFAAAERYPETAPKVFSVYGDDETFQKVLDRFGHPVIPVIAFFVENGSRELQIRQAIADALDHIWAGKRPTWNLAAITREQIGLLAIYRLAARGNEMLAEFEIVGGTARRKPITRLILGLKDLLLGGVDDIETIMVRGERLPSWREVGLATLDVSVIAGGIGAMAKAARVGAGTAEIAEKSTVRLAAEGAYEAISVVGRTAVRVSPIAFAYVAITRPQLIASAGGWIAEQLGAQRSVGIFVVYWLGVFLVLQCLRPLLWLCRPVSKAVFRATRYAYDVRAARLSRVAAPIAATGR